MESIIRFINKYGMVVVFVLSLISALFLAINIDFIRDMYKVCQTDNDITDFYVYLVGFIGMALSAVMLIIMGFTHQTNSSFFSCSIIFMFVSAAVSSGYNAIEYFKVSSFVMTLVYLSIPVSILVSFSKKNKVFENVAYIAMLFVIVKSLVDTFTSGIMPCAIMFITLSNAIVYYLISDEITRANEEKI